LALFDILRKGKQLTEKEKDKVKEAPTNIKNSVA